MKKVKIVGFRRKALFATSLVTALILTACSQTSSEEAAPAESTEPVKVGI